jgi:hypothetical protein
MLNYQQTKKYNLLIMSLVADLIGFASYSIPGIGEVSDIVWAPISAWFLTRLYKGTAGKAGATINFIEEILPGSDFIPTFTFMWFYTYVLKNEDETRGK